MNSKEHIPGCYVGGTVDCPANFSLYDESKNKHWWSGWPGAYCLKCNAEDLFELCLAESCKCCCHNEFWEEYNKYELYHTIIDKIVYDIKGRKGFGDEWESIDTEQQYEIKNSWAKILEEEINKYKMTNNKDKHE